jgi:hypothetical protein
LIPAFAKQAVYFANAAELGPPPGAAVIAGFGVGLVAALVAAFAGMMLAATIAIEISAIALFFVLKVMGQD